MAIHQDFLHHGPLAWRLVLEVDNAAEWTWKCQTEGTRAISLVWKPGKEGVRMLPVWDRSNYTLGHGAPATTLFTVHPRLSFWEQQKQQGGIREEKW